jgi:hypothetical protein
MDFKSLTFDVCRCYIRDTRSLLGEDIYNQVLGWTRSRDISRLASCTSRFPFAYANVNLYRALRQIEAFFKKNAIYAEPAVCRRSAELSFQRAERICRITNRRIDYYCSNRHRLDADVRLWLSRSEAYISRVLGPFSDFFERLPELVRLTSGATSVDSRRNSAPYKKVSLRMVCTERAVPYVRALSRFYGYGPQRCRSVASNRIEFVPKSWKTDRTIACEPTGNLPLQLAFDTYAKTKLKRFGINLSDQGRNQELSRQGSIDGSFATIDLAMASDTLSFNTVAALLPADWLKYLTDVRSPFGRLSSGLIKYAKFSSMGNGATFSLETLVFASACVAVGSKKFSVYGDDIVIETELYDDLMRFLRFLGFIPNVDKSFSSGPFRESCGVDSYNGTDVTPFYLRDWSGLKALLCHNVNGLVRIGHPYGELWRFCLDFLRQMHLPFVPENEDTMSGVMIYITQAYSKKLIKVVGQLPYFRAYKPRNKTIRTDDSRSLFLWYLDKYRSRDRKSMSEPLLRSRTPAFDHKYVRKWSFWTVPEVGAFDHLYWWSEFIQPPGNPGR